MRIFILGIVLFCLATCFGQIGGALIVTVHQNLTGSLNDNIILPEVKTILTNSNYSKTCLLKNEDANRWHCIVPTGYYELKCIINDSTEIIIEHVLIRSDHITFVEVLDEPKTKLNFWEKRQRKRFYANMKDI